jgi:proton-dependent oligopeptide transporter, POT family
MPSREEIQKSLESVRQDKRFFGHPRGLATLFFTEFGERFSYYGMRALLIYYMTHKVLEGGLGFADAKAGSVYGLYVSMVYLLCLGGGWVADRITGQRKAVVIGGFMIALGEFCLVAPTETSFYSGLVLLMMGTGMLKGNVSTIVGQLYAPGDPRRDAGFSIFYMGINLGAMLSPILCGLVAKYYGWRMGFALAGIGMLAGLAQYAIFHKHLGSAGLYPASTGDPVQDSRQKRQAILFVGGGLGLFAILAILGGMGVIEFSATAISSGLGWVLVAISTAVFSWLIFGSGWTPEERKSSAAILVLFVSSALFWASFEQAGSTLSLFAERSTDRHVFGWIFPPAWFQNVEATFVVLLAPVFAWLWLKLARRGKEPSSPAKFAWALVFGAAAFAILIPASMIAIRGTQVALWWLIGTYFLQALGELSLSPVGLSAVSKLAPVRIQGFTMGIWFLSTSIGNWMAGHATSFYASMSLPTFFATVAGFTLVVALALTMVIKPTVRLMPGMK